MNEQHNVDERNDRNTERPVIETASATTSPENAKSGSLPYVITGITLAFLTVFSLVMGGCMSFLFNEVALDMENDATEYPVSVDDYEDFWDEYDEFMNDYDIVPPTTEHSNDPTATVADVLDFDLAAYTTSLSSEVSASSYAGTPAAAREFTRSVIAVDDDYSSQVVACLNEAARDESVRTQKIDEAVELCAKASKDVAAVKLPSIEKDEGGSIADVFGSAKTEAANRWDLMGAELALLQTEEEVTTSDLWDADGKVVETTTKAGNLFEEAMNKAANL